MPSSEVYSLLRNALGVSKQQGPEVCQGQHYHQQSKGDLILYKILQALDLLQSYETIVSWHTPIAHESSVTTSTQETHIRLHEQKFFSQGPYPTFFLSNP